MRTDEQKARSRENARRWRERNPDAAREASRHWRERNPEKAAEAGHRSRQRTYDPAKSKAWREARLADPAYRKRINRQQNERARAIRAHVNAVKVERGCVDCGYRSHHAALDFDHVGGDKAINVCNAKSIAQAEREIAKCVVRCSNCHRVKTWERLQAR